MSTEITRAQRCAIAIVPIQMQIEKEGREGKSSVETSKRLQDTIDAHYPHYDELVGIAKAYRNLLRTSAHTDGEVATFHHIEAVLEAVEKGTS